VFPHPVDLKHSVDQQEIERSAAVQQVMKVTLTPAALPTLVHSPLVGQTLCVSETVTEPSVAALKAILETLL